MKLKHHRRKWCQAGRYRLCSINAIWGNGWVGAAARGAVMSGLPAHAHMKCSVLLPATTTAFGGHFTLVAPVPQCPASGPMAPIFRAVSTTEYLRTRVGTVQTPKKPSPEYKAGTGHVYRTRIIRVRLADFHRLHLGHRVSGFVPWLNPLSFLHGIGCGTSECFRLGCRSLPQPLAARSGLPAGADAINRWPCCQK